jgi:hypothetical protein
VKSQSRCADGDSPKNEKTNKIVAKSHRIRGIAESVWRGSADLIL